MKLKDVQSGQFFRPENKPKNYSRWNRFCVILKERDLDTRNCIVWIIDGRWVIDRQVMGKQTKVSDYKPDHQFSMEKTVECIFEHGIRDWYETREQEMRFD